MNTTQAKPKEIELQVFGVNQVNKITSLEVANLLSQLKNYEGKKLFTQDGNGFILLWKKLQNNFKNDMSIVLVNFKR